MRALTSASNIARRELCPGSAAAEADFPQQEDSEYSAEGTLLHEVDADPSKAESVELTAEQRDVLAIAKRADDVIFRAVCTNLAIPDDEPFEEAWEEELWFYRGLKKLFPGHSDRRRFYPRFSLLIIIDKKFGRLEVTPAESNMQLRSYACMGARRWKPNNIVVAINQPRLPFKERLTIAEYTADNIPAATDHVLRVWDGAHNSDGSPRTDVRRIAGEDQCRYCSARIHCPEYREKFEFLAKPADLGKDFFVAKLQTISNVDLDRVQEAVRFAALIADSVKKEIVKRVESKSMTNYELEPSGNSSRITDPSKAVSLLEGIGFTKDEVIKRADFGMGNLAEDYQVKNGGTMVAAKKMIKNTLMPVLAITPKAPSLKRLRAADELEVLPPEGQLL